jgi:hypothetical protein
MTAYGTAIGGVAVPVGGGPPVSYHGITPPPGYVAAPWLQTPGGNIGNPNVPPPAQNPINPVRPTELPVSSTLKVSGINSDSSFSQSVPVQAMNPADVAALRMTNPERFYTTSGPGVRFERYYTGPVYEVRQGSQIVYRSTSETESQSFISKQNADKIDKIFSPGKTPSFTYLGPESIGSTATELYNAPIGTRIAAIASSMATPYGGEVLSEAVFGGGWFNVNAPIGRNIATSASSMATSSQPTLGQSGSSWFKINEAVAKSQLWIQAHNTAEIPRFVSRGTGPTSEMGMQGLPYIKASPEFKEGLQGVASSPLGWVAGGFVFRTLGAVAPAAVKLIGTVTPSWIAGGLTKTAVTEGPGAAVREAQQTAVSFPFFLAGAKAPFVLKYGKIETGEQTPRGALSEIQTRLAEEATARGGYVGGSAALRLQLPEGGFRDIGDVDTYFKSREAVKGFADVALKEYQSGAAAMGRKPEEFTINTEQFGKYGQLKIWDVTANKSVFDVNYNPASDANILNVGGINVRKANQILSDKRYIVKSASSQKPETVLKAKTDLELAEEAAKLPMFNVNLKYGGIYIPEAKEGNVMYILGRNAEGKFIWGKPTASDLNLSPKDRLVFGPPEERIVVKKLSSGNIESMPQSAFEKGILTQRPVIESLGYSSSDVTQKVGPYLRVEEYAKNISKINEGKLPLETKNLKPEQLKPLWESMKANPKSYVQVKGSIVELAQRNPELMRTAGDIEVTFKNEAQAMKTGKVWADIITKAGLKAELKNVPKKGLGIYDLNENELLDLQFKGKPESKISGASGYRYGFKIDRGNTKLQGIKAQKWGEQSIRKGGTSITWWSEGKIEPPQHRAKEPADWYAQIKSGAKEGKLPRITYIELWKWRTAKWTNPEVEEKFKEIETKGYRPDITAAARGEKPPVPPLKSIPIAPTTPLQSISRQPSMIARQPSTVVEPSSPMTSHAAKSPSVSIFPSASSRFRSASTSPPSASASSSASASASPYPSVSPYRSASGRSVSASASASASPYPSVSASVSPYKQPPPSPSKYPFPGIAGQPYKEAKQKKKTVPFAQKKAGKIMLTPMRDPLTALGEAFRTRRAVLKPLPQTRAVKGAFASRLFGVPSAGFLFGQKEVRAAERGRR